MPAIATNHATSLDLVLAYRHPATLRRYCKDHDASMQEADEVFREMLKFLYLSYRAAIDIRGYSGCVISSEIEKIDEMWHTFLLFTIDYADFCDRYFGFFMHHVPNESENGSTVAPNEVRTALERQLGLVYDVLGEETLVAWYDHCRYAAYDPDTSVL